MLDFLRNQKSLVLLHQKIYHHSLGWGGVFNWLHRIKEGSEILIASYINFKPILYSQPPLNLTPHVPATCNYSAFRDLLASWDLNWLVLFLLPIIPNCIYFFLFILFNLYCIFFDYPLVSQIWQDSKQSKRKKREATGGS